VTQNEKNQPTLDISRINFPLDRVTIGTVRKAARRFDELEEQMFDDLEAGIWTERLIARQAFDAELQGVKPNRIGKVNLELALDRREWVSGMDPLYRNYGLSSGPKQSAELIRGIEAQAIAQARALQGRPR
jgi:hypothetical protein